MQAGVVTLFSSGKKQLWVCRVDVVGRRTGRVGIGRRWRVEQINYSWYLHLGLSLVRPHPRSRACRHQIVDMAVCRMDSEEVDGRWVGRQRREGCMRVPEDCWAQVVQAYNDGWADPAAWVQCHAWIFTVLMGAIAPVQVLQKRPPVSANT
jgi:hypothetical protein